MNELTPSVVKSEIAIASDLQDKFSDYQYGEFDDNETHVITLALDIFEEIAHRWLARKGGQMSIDEKLRLARNLYNTFTFCRPKRTIELKFSPEEEEIMAIALQDYINVLLEYQRKELMK